MSLTAEQIAWLQRNRTMSGSSGGGVQPPPPGDPPPIVEEIRALLTAFQQAIHRIEVGGIPAAKLEPDLKAFQSRFDAASKPVAGAKQERARDAALKKLKSEIEKKLAEVKTDADRQSKAQTGGADAAITDLIDAAAKLIDNAMPDKKPDLDSRLQQLRADAAAVARMSDPAKQSTARGKADTDAKQLIKDASQAVDKDHEAEASKQVQDAYKSALANKYGISIGKYSDMTPPNMHLDDLYDTLENVPLGHVAQNKMKDLSYKQKWMVGAKGNQHGIGFSSGVGMELGAFGNETWLYNDPETKKPFVDPTTKKPEQPNGFRITVLHELGHSVDKRYGVMKTGDEAYGGWAKVDGGALVTLLAAPFIAKFRGVLDEAEITDLVKGAVFNGSIAAAPPDGNPAAWGEIAKFLGPWAAMRASSAPWSKPRLYFGGRNYVWSSNYGTWYSYSKAVRDKLETTDYQWSAPAEWFAELYAIYWYRKKPPPAAIPPAMAAFLPGGSGAGDPNAQKP